MTITRVNSGKVSVLAVGMSSFLIVDVIVVGGEERRFSFLVTGGTAIVAVGTGSLFFFNTDRSADDARQLFVDLTCSPRSTSSDGFGALVVVVTAGADNAGGCWLLTSESSRLRVDGFRIDAFDDDSEGGGTGLDGTCVFGLSLF